MERDSPLKTVGLVAVGLPKDGRTALQLDWTDSADRAGIRHPTRRVVSHLQLGLGRMAAGLPPDAPVDLLFCQPGPHFAVLRPTKSRLRC